MSWSSRKKKESILCTAYFAWKQFFNICVLSQYIVYWIRFQDIRSFTYEKTLRHTLYYLFLKFKKVFSVSLKYLQVFHKKKMWKVQYIYVTFWH